MSELRKLPRIDALEAAKALSGFPRPIRVAAARAAVERIRRAALEGVDPDTLDAVELALAEAASLERPSLHPAINVSGVVLHTGLGRARLAPSVAKHVAEIAASHSTLEMEVESGARGNRQSHVRRLLVGLTGAEDALVVNNAAAGVVLSLSALAQGREVILSRGQMVEIGGSFRMPDIVRQSGCKLVEVGCTNKTRLSDYTEAITDETAAILRCHPSNFKIVGFTAEPSLAELAVIARRESVLCIDDLGSGCLVDTTRFGLPKQATLQDSVSAGADLVVASGDKLLGGPQAGLILGRRDVVARLERHPLARAFRVDKLTLAALEATLRLYRDGRELEIPTLSALARDLATVKRKAARLARAYRGAAEVRASVTEVGGGSAPGLGLPSYAAVLPGDKPDLLCHKLRRSDTPIVARVQDNAVWLDPRTLEADEVVLVERVLRELNVDGSS